MAKAKKLPSGSWRVQAYIGVDIHGKKQYKSFTAGSKKEAELLALNYQISPGKSRKREKITLNQAVDEYIILKSNILSPSTIRGYRQIQRNSLSEIINLPIGKIDEDTIQHQINGNAAKYSSKSVKNQYGLISVVLKRYGVVLENVALPPKEKAAYSVPTIDDITKILEAIKGHPYELQFLCALWLGMRQSEIAGLKWENYNGKSILIKGAKVFDEKNKLVDRSINKSFAGTREIFLSKYLIAKFENIKRPKGFIFETTPRQISMAFSKLLADNALPHFRVHDLRHANASLMLYLNVPDKYAMERLGQNTANVLKNIYQHTYEKEKQRVDDMLNSFLENQISHEKSHDKPKIRIYRRV